ncbi:hypothetical protein GCM10011502_15820 [Oceanisphaera marina]|uniref:DUF484 domain-containing protein n=1 Tax=Oceanisphaera marina TaxID=2017550 RepID=A0ABQ1IKB7_9GAMM|nr:DUF484 family protein [Oceanisphaera marina]GGB43341.1 hypothetical protein GCM10011502_15820 [Oceanisphaera marina]
MTDSVTGMNPCVNTGLDDSQIAEYLLAQPQFFERQPSLLEQLRLPHEQRGSVSLVEVKLDRQRQRIYELEDEITELMMVAGENERIFRVYMDLMPRLFECTSVLELELCIRSTLQQQLRVQAVQLVLDPRAYPDATSSAGEQLERLYRERMASQLVYLGRLGKEEKLGLFQDSLVNSCALIRLGAKGELGLLAFGSADGSHYGPGMDTLLINQLADVLALLLPRLMAAEQTCHERG